MRFKYCGLQVARSLAALYNHAEDIASFRYDFIIIGGGTAGSVLANRLTENPSFSVLVLEAGGAVPTEVPFYCTMPHPQYDWNYTTTPQVGLNGNSIALSRGFVLGGSSSINGMFYTRGSEDDFDRLARVTGDMGWSWEHVQPYIRRNERWTAPADHHDTTGQYDPSIHSVTGITSVSLAGYPQPINDKIIQASRELGAEFAFNLDMNSGRPLGLGWLQTTIDGGNRSSAATSYLAPTFVNRENLHVLVNARVTRLLRTIGTSDTGMVFTGVEFAQGANGTRYQVRASKEVLLSAGTVGTPQILMKSGIGNASYLLSMGITPLLNLPSVGRNFSDHPRLANNWYVDSRDTWDDINRNATLASNLEREWKDTGKGPLVDTFVSHLAFIRLDESVLEELGDPSAGLNTAHYELGFSNGLVGALPPPPGNFLSITTRVVTPTSRGSITLKSSDPFDDPIIDPGYLSTVFDITAMRAAVKSSFKFLSAPVWSGYILKPYGALENATTEELLDAYIRNYTGSSAHAVGTAAMSTVNATFGVVDPDFKVKHVQGLRVIDASVFPFVPSGHTQAPVYIIAERAADFLKSNWEA